MKVTLPPKDDILAPGVFNEGLPGPRWFDFSSAPDVEGFDSSSCATDITWAGPRAFHMNQRKPYSWVGVKTSRLRTRAHRREDVADESLGAYCILFIVLLYVVLLLCVSVAACDCKMATER